MFQLTKEETVFWARSRSQIAILKRGKNIKYLPYAFTEHGAIMAASVLNTEKAIQISVFVVEEPHVPYRSSKGSKKKNRQRAF